MKEQRTMEVPSSVNARYVHIATSDPEFSIMASEELSGKGSEVSIDPGMEIYQRWSPEQLRRILPKCTRFFGNLGEWDHLGEKMGWTGDVFNFEGKGVPYYQEAFEFIEEAVITLGSTGAVLINSQNIHHEDPVDTGPVVDTTGAGDAFRGGFYAALLKGYTSLEALKFGNGMGALSIKGEGPQNYEAEWDEIFKLSSI
jgi:sugar/nucleoside kinase (ribokinase family)